MPNRCASCLLVYYDREDYKKSRQVLIYPALQALDLKTPSFQSYDPLLSKVSMAAYWTLYLTGSEDGHKQLLQNMHHSVAAVRDNVVVVTGESVRVYDD